MRSRISWPLLLLLLGTAGPLAGQEVRGRVVESGDRRGVAGANVLLLDDGGRRISGWLTDATGVFLLRAATPGTYRVRVEMIGRRTVESADVELAADSVFSLTLELPVEPIRLDGIAVTGAKVCRARPDDGATQAVWDEARKALSSRETLLAANLYRFDIVRFERMLHPVTLSVVDEKETGRMTTDRDPFVSAPADQLAKDGYAEDLGDGRFYLHGPGADVLLSEPFLDTHCFNLERDDRHPGELGLAFRPVPGRRVTDIQGVFWLDEHSALLTTLEFTYTNLPSSAAAGTHGGRAVFQRLPNGGVIVESWEIRTPVIDEAELPRDAAGGRRRTTGRIVLLKAEGGEVVRVVGRERGERDRARLAGSGPRSRWRRAGLPVPGLRPYIPVS